jgi:hypothetical protein
MSPLYYPIEVVNVQNPMYPYLANTIIPASLIYHSPNIDIYRVVVSVAVSNNYLVTGWEEDLSFVGRYAKCYIEIRNINPPNAVVDSLVTTTNVNYAQTYVATVDNYIYSTERFPNTSNPNILKVWNITDKQVKYSTATLSTKLRVEGSYALYTNSSGSIYTYDITNRENPLLKGTFPITKSSYTFKDNYMFGIKSGDSQMSIIRTAEYDMSAIAQSTNILPSGDLIRVKLSPTQNLNGGSVNYFVSFDGTNFQSITTNTYLCTSGTKIYWKANLSTANPFRTPTISNLTIDYDVNSAPTVSVTSPTTGNKWKGTKTITWNAGDINNGICNDKVDKVNIYYEEYDVQDNIWFWYPLASNLSNTGSWSWNTAGGTYPCSTKIAIRAYDTRGTSSYAESGIFYVDNESPSIPIIVTELPYTKGLSNTVSCNISTDACVGGVLYWFQKSTDSTFTGAGTTPLWRSSKDTTFTGLTNGQKYYYRVKACDGIGNVAGWSNITSSIQDNSAPTGSVSINANATFTNSSAVSLTLSATDNGSGVSHMIISNDGVFDTEVWENYSSTKNWTLVAGEGIKTVYVKFKDSVENISSLYSDNITVDMTPPSVPIVVDIGFDVSGNEMNDANYTATTTKLKANWSSQDGSGSGINYYNIKATYFSLGMTKRATLVSVSNITSTTYTFTGFTLNTTETTYFIEVSAVDKAGNVSNGESNGIEVDVFPPTDIPYVYDGLSTDIDYQTAVNQLSANWGYSGDESGWTGYLYAIGTTPGGSDKVNWTDVGVGQSQVVSFGAPLPIGTKYYFSVKSEDIVGNTSNVIWSDGIIVDNTPPNSLVVNDDGVYTKVKTQLNANWSAIDNESGIAEYKYSVYYSSSPGAVSGTIVQDTTITASSSVSLSISLLENKYYYFAVKARNNAGIWSGIAYSDGIFVDATAPAGSIVINSNATYTNSASVNLTLSATDNGSGIDKMRFSNDNISWSSWESYSTAKQWTLSSSNGTKTVYVQYTDKAGNSATISDNIVFDNIKPVGSVVINNNANCTKSTSVNLSITTNPDTSGVYQMSFSNNNSTWTAYENYATSKTKTLVSGDGDKTIYIKFKDRAGNESNPYSDNIKLDTTLPVISISGILLTDGQYYNTNKSISVSFTDANLTSSVSKLNGASFTGSTTASNDGTYTLYVKAVDCANNIVQDTINFVIDKTAPTITVTGISNNQCTNQSVKPIITVTDNNLKSKIITLNGQSYNSGTTIFNDGSYTLYTKAEDKADNFSENTIIFIIDKVSPAVSISGVSDGVKYNNDVTPVISFSGATTTILKLNNNSFTSGTTIFNDGTYILYAKAEDCANPTAEKTIRFVIDKTPPTLTVSKPANDEIITGANYSIEYSTSADAYRVFFLKSLNSTNWDTITTDSTPDGIHTFDTRIISDNDYYFKTIAVDSVSNSTQLIKNTSIDNTAPVVNISGVDNNAYYNTSITPTISVLDAHLQSVSYLLNNQSYTPNTAITNDNNYTLKVIAIDKVDFSTEKIVSFTIDKTPPAISMNVENNAYYTSNISLQVNITDANLQSQTITVNGNAYTPGMVISSEGTHMVNASAVDKAGNDSQKQVSFILDKTAPSGTIAINSNVVYTSNASVVLTLNATDGTSGIAQMSFSADSLSWGSWESYNTIKQWTLASGDGIKTVYVRFKDNAGNIFTTKDDIILDTQKPTGSISINNNANYTKSTSTTLTLSSYDAGSGISQMRISNDGTFDTEVWESYLASKSWSLTSGNGTKTVYIQFKDNAENISITYSDDIILDTVKPTGTIVINNDAVYTNTLNSTLTLSATDGTSGLYQMRFSNNNSTWSSWQGYSTSKGWTLLSYDGTKKVYTQFKDKAGNISVTYSDSITLDTQKPIGSIVINNNTNYTNIAGVTLTLSSTDTTSGLHQMRFSNDNVSWNSWESYNSAKSWTLTAGEGSKNVYTQFKDNAGNISVVYSDNITLDTQKPAGTVAINNNAGYTNSVNVVLTLTSYDETSGISQMSFSNNNSTWSSWQTYNSTKNWTLTTGDGNKSAYTKLKDKAGNISNVYSDNIILDTTSPAITINNVSNGVYYKTNVSPAITITETNLDSSLIKLDGQLYTSGTAISTEGNHTLYVRAKDKANWITEKTITFTIDKTIPTITIIGVSNNQCTTQNITPVINITDTNLDSSKTVITLNGNPFASGTTISKDTTYTLYAKVVDKAGSTVEKTVSFRIDKSVPMITIVGVHDGMRTSDNVTVTISFAGADTEEFILDYVVQMDTTVIITTEGLHIITARALDCSHPIADTTIQFTIDRSPPDLFFNKPIANEHIGGMYVFTYDVDTSDVSEVRFEYSKDSKEWELADFDTTFDGKYIFYTKMLPDGEYFIRIVIKDKAGNRNADTTFVMIDNTPPSKPTLQAIDKRVGGSIMIKWDKVEDAVRYYLKSGINLVKTIDDSENIYEYQFTGLENNIVHTFSISSEDIAGNKSMESIVSITPTDDDDTPPTFRDFSIASVPSGHTFSIFCRITDTSGIDTSSVYLRIVSGGKTQLLGFTERKMKKESGDVYSVSIPSLKPNTILHYQISARDNDISNGTESDKMYGTSETKQVKVYESGDYNYDGVIDAVDIVLFTNIWKVKNPNPLTELYPNNNDIENLEVYPDGEVGFDDLMMMIQIWKGRE